MAERRAHRTKAPTRGTREEPAVATAARARHIVSALRRAYRDADCALHHSNALELLAATILSAQCTDERVNQVTPALFRTFPDAAALARADEREVERLVRPTGFFRNKARALVGLGRALVERHGGEVPESMEDLVRLPGVGRKTANVVRGTWFGLPAIPVDTHVTRLTNRLALTRHADPLKIEADLQRLIPESAWTFTSHALIWHGRRVCAARRPACERCVLRPHCPFPGAAASGKPGARAL
jgi:endonuclease-3